MRVASEGDEKTGSGGLSSPSWALQTGARD